MMTTLENETEPTTGKLQSGVAALVCGVLGVLTAVWMFWMIVPGLVFGIAAIALGWRSRRAGAGERGSVAMALGIVALLLVPSVIALVDMADDWGRECALNPTKPDC